MGIAIGRIFGIEIRVQLGWTVVLGLIAVIAVGELTQLDPDLPTALAWALGGLVALGFFVSSVTHDLAHAIVARRRRVDVRSITVSFFGASSPFDATSPDPGHDMAIAASGPIASIVIGGVLFALTVGAIALGDEFAAAAGVLSVLVFLNLILGVVNLVPAYPLDGGRIIRDIAWRRSGSEQSGWQTAARSGRITGFVVIAFGIAYLLVEGGATGAMVALTGWFLILSANSVRDRVKLDDLVGGHAVREAMEADPITVTPTLTIDTFAGQLLDRETPLTAVPVVVGDEIVGMFGVSQIRRIRRGDWPNTRVEDVMIKPPRLVFLAPDDTLKSGLERLHRIGVDGLPVVDDGRMVGVLTRRGVGAFIAARQGKPAA
ncbi:MAG TPA: site-2 protease family protein [Candidatus Limnocylindria bacterium]|nr:site-2 protease family protein [Candidatus Limnocylindria bacterium]